MVFAMTNLCANCKAEALGHFCIALYPHAALMRYYRVTEPLAFIPTTQHLCQACCDSMEPGSYVTQDKIDAHIAAIEKETGTVIDRIAGISHVLLPCNHPAILAMNAQLMTRSFSIMQLH